MKKLGIVSGMGALAGLRLAKYLLDRTKDGRVMEDHDFPEFLLYNLPVRGMDETGITDPELVKNQLVKTLSKMETWGCEQVLIACNSVHVFLPELEDYFSGIIVNMIDAAAAATRFKKVGVLCSSTTRLSGLFEQSLLRRGITPVTATDAEQAVLNEAIKSAISDQSIRGNRTDVESVVISMSRRGAEQFIIGCTELPLILETDISADFIDAGQEAIKISIKNG